jgi:hypothetical protein
LHSSYLSAQNKVFGLHDWLQHSLEDNFKVLIVVDVLRIIEGHLVDDKGELDELCVMRYEV